VRVCVCVFTHIYIAEKKVNLNARTLKEKYFYFGRYFRK